MAARGSIAKQQITETILNTFEGSFTYDKEIRIPIIEDGEVVQIKVTLTAAKVNVDNAGGGSTIELPSQDTNNVDPTLKQITNEEKAEVENLISKLGL